MRHFSHKLVPPPPPGTLTWRDLDTSRPIVLEIGIGAGMHAMEWATAHPLKTLVGIERTTKCLGLLARQAVGPAIPNLYALRADAVNWVTHNVPENSLEQIFILYPNPYPKSKQGNLRWHNMPFMGFLKTRLKPDGVLTLATNKKDYCDEAAKVMPSSWQMPLQEIRVLDSTFPPRTHFEKKYLERGETCWNLTFAPH